MELGTLDRALSGGARPHTFHLEQHTPLLPILQAAHLCMSALI